MGVQGEGYDNMEQTLLAERYKLDWRSLDEGSKPRRGKVRCLPHGMIIVEENTNNLRPKPY